MYTNDFGEKFFVNYSSYDILTTDSKKYDRVINPFDLNITKNNPYNDEEKNKSCFLGIESKNEKVLLIFKTKEIPNFDEMFELYYNYNTDSYDITYNHDLINKDNQLVVAYGTSIIILDINTYKVINYVSSEAIDRYAINIFYREKFYIIEDIEHNFTFFDENLNQVTEENELIKKIKAELIKK